LPAGFINRLLDLSTQHLPERYSEEELRGQPGVVAQPTTCHTAGC